MKPNTPIKPLERIALSLSGGGYRASSFQLGVMSYLNHKNYKGEALLKNVKAISTVSGGSITGVFYAAQVQEGHSFESIYKKLYTWLATTDLVKQSLEKLNSQGEWQHDYKRKNLINAFAELYNETLLDGKTMEVFSDFKKSHLEFVCFNSTEFYTGLRYRFQTTFFGTSGLRLGKQLYSSFRLGDVIAASSAFSGGFEPIAMPEDFVAPASEVYKTIKTKARYRDQSIGLMDGGIVDNQGISSIKDYQDNKNVAEFDLILISDVDSPYINPFKYTATKFGGIREKTLSNLTQSIKTIKGAAILIILLVLIGGVVLMGISKFENSTLFGVGIATSALGLLFLMIYMFLRKKAFSLIEIIKKYTHQLIPEYFRERFPVVEIKNIKLKYLETLLLDRINSLKLLIPTIFLKQIRRLQYNSIYNDDTYEYRRMGCLIKELTRIDFDKKLRNDYQKIAPFLKDFKGDSYRAIMGNNIKKYIDAAAKFGTTLWFTDQDKLEEQLKCLVISGQITCCQNLLIYLTKYIHFPDSGYDELPEDEKKQLKKLHRGILKDWRRFKEEPVYLFEALK